MATCIPVVMVRMRTPAHRPGIRLLRADGFSICRRADRQLLIARQSHHSVHRPGERGRAYRTGFWTRRADLGGFATKIRHAVGRTGDTGDAFHPPSCSPNRQGQTALAAAQGKAIWQLLADTLGFRRLQADPPRAGPGPGETCERMQTRTRERDGERARCWAIGRKLIPSRGAITRFGEVMHWSRRSTREGRSMKVDGRHYRPIWPGEAGQSVEVMTRTGFACSFAIQPWRRTRQAAADAGISTMVVRGAPLIGSPAALGWRWR